MMMLFWLVFSIMLNIMLLCFVFYYHDQMTYWHSKFVEEMKVLYPIEWDYDKREDEWTEK